MIHPDVQPILKRLDRWGEELDEHTRAYADAVRRSVAVDHAYEMAWAKAIIRAEGGNEAQRKGQATLACEAELLAKVGSDAELDALKALIRNCQAQVERLRSWSAASRSSMELSGVGRP